MKSIKLLEEKVGSQWLITSPDVPGLNVAHRDLETARSSVPAAMDMLKAMSERRGERDKIKQAISKAS